MGKIISIINNKGGVGKTSSTGILAELLAFTGCRVLCVDLDQQSNLSMLFNCYVKDPVPVLNWREYNRIISIPLSKPGGNWVIDQTDLC